MAEGGGIILPFRCLLNYLLLVYVLWVRGGVATVTTIVCMYLYIHVLECKCWDTSKKDLDKNTGFWIVVVVVIADECDGHVHTHLFHVMPYTVWTDTILHNKSRAATEDYFPHKLIITGCSSNSWVYKIFLKILQNAPQKINKCLNLRSWSRTLLAILLNQSSKLFINNISDNWNIDLLTNWALKGHYVVFWEDIFNQKRKTLIDRFFFQMPKQTT